MFIKKRSWITHKRICLNMFSVNVGFLDYTVDHTHSTVGTKTFSLQLGRQIRERSIYANSFLYLHVRPLIGIWEMGGREKHGCLSQQTFLSCSHEKKYSCTCAKVESYFITRRLRRKKVLIVLDDVSSSEQLEDIISDFDCLGPGSREIVTTRDKHIFSHVDEICEVNELNDCDFFLLFHLNAFREEHPNKDMKSYQNLFFLKVSESVIAYCKGNPLPLKFWERSMEKSHNKSTVISFPPSGIESDLIQEMGIIHQESIKNLEDKLRCSLWFIDFSSLLFFFFSNLGFFYSDFVIACFRFKIFVHINTMLPPVGGGFCVPAVARHGGGEANRGAGDEGRRESFQFHAIILRCGWVETGSPILKESKRKWFDGNRVEFGVLR
ncbi:hypothetical protein GYH30_002895 [Glycine max]|nr:hypothetical protein GYH30_002895 [Glycine max]